MADYHLSIKTVSRSAGRSATAAAAYRAGCEIVDARTGECHDYSRKRGVLSATLIVPPGAPEWAHDRAALWNAAEASEKRKNSTVAREFEIALPHELTHEQRQQLAHEFAREIMQRHGCVVDVAIHAPSDGSDPRNQHAHLLCSTRRLTPDGFGEKTRELDDLKTGEVTYWRERWAQLANQHLERAGHTARIDHRSLAEQGIDREPTRHLGPAATGFERRTGQPSWLRQQHEQEALEARLQAAKRAGEIERQAAPVASEIIDLQTQLRAALDERDRREGVMTHALEQWRGYLGDRPEAHQVIVVAGQVRRRQPGAIEQAEQLTRSLNVAEKAAQERQEAQRQAEAHRQRLEAEQAAKRAQEAQLLASLRTPSPTRAGSPADRAADFIEARRRERVQHAETSAPEPRGGDQRDEAQRRTDAFRELLERQQREHQERQQEQEGPTHEWDGPEMG